MKTKVITITKNLRVVEHMYHANNRCCLDYAVLLTRDSEERFCGYYRTIPTESELDYAALQKAYDSNNEMPEWINDGE